MNKFLKKVIIFSILCASFICINVNAREMVQTDLVRPSGFIGNIKDGKFTLKNPGFSSYTNYGGKGPTFFVTAKAVNDYVRDIDVEISFNLYDKDKKLIETIKQTLFVPKKGESLYREFVYFKDKKYKVDDVKYYSVGTLILSDVKILESKNKENFYVEDYKVDIKVNKNNVYNVETSFLATFKDKVTSIEYGIPFRNYYQRPDGTKINKRAMISNIKVDDFYTVETIKGIRTLKIGKPDRTRNKKNFLIKYDYNMGHDTLKDNDEFVFPLLISSPIRIDGVNFRIELPEGGNYEKIEFVDLNGLKLENAKYIVKDNVVTGKILGVTEEDSFYLVRLILEDNFFKDTDSNISFILILCFIIPIVFIILSGLLLYVSKRVDKARKYNNSFYINKELNSLEVGYLLHGSIKDNDIASLLFCLANKGYINIVETKKGYRIDKVKDYDSNDKLEKILMEQIFRSKDQLTRNDLNIAFKDINELMMEKIYENEDRSNIFIHPIFNYKLIYWLMIMIILVINTFNMLIEYQPSVIFINCLLSGIGYVVMIKGVLGESVGLEKMIYCLAGLILIISPVVITSYEAFFVDNLYLLAYIIGFISMLIIASISKMMSNRTRYGRRMLCKIKAYKKYLLEVNDYFVLREYKNNKDLFFTVLPYAFVIGIPDNWLDRFRDKELSKPKWYKASSFSLKEFYTDVKNIYSDIFMALKNNGSKK